MSYRSDDVWESGDQVPETEGEKSTREANYLKGEEETTKKGWERAADALVPIRQDKPVYPAMSCEEFVRISKEIQAKDESGDALSEEASKLLGRMAYLADEIRGQEENGGEYSPLEILSCTGEVDDEIWRKHDPNRYIYRICYQGERGIMAALEKCGVLRMVALEGYSVEQGLRYSNFVNLAIQEYCQITGEQIPVVHRCYRVNAWRKTPCECCR